jgi:hypothetical protein
MWSRSLFSRCARWEIQKCEGPYFRTFSTNTLTIMSDQKPLQTSYGNPYVEMHQPEVVSERTEIQGVKFLTAHEWYGRHLL